jgi:hypothetical protein
LGAKQVVHMNGPSGEPVSVKLGFSWPAFFFGALWALLKGMWLYFGVLALSAGLLNLFSWTAAQTHSAALEGASIAGMLLYMCICGWFGNRWFIASLRSRGFRPASEA